MKYQVPRSHHQVWRSNAGSTSCASSNRKYSARRQKRSFKIRRYVECPWKLQSKAELPKRECHLPSARAIFQIGVSIHPFPRCPIIFLPVFCLFAHNYDSPKKNVYVDDERSEREWPKIEAQTKPEPNITQIRKQLSSHFMINLFDGASGFLSAAIEIGKRRNFRLYANVESSRFRLFARIYFVSLKPK